MPANQLESRWIVTKRWKRLLWAAAFLGVIGLGGVAALSGAVRPLLENTRDYIARARSTPEASNPSATDPPVPSEPGREGTPPSRWNRQLQLQPEQLKALGLQVVSVQPQSQPMTLELLGSTEYDPDTLAKIRPRFDALVNKVHTSLGQTVKKGQVLIDLYSAQLAEAKGAFEEGKAQWDHDRRLLERQKPLFEQGALTEKTYFDTVNDERKSSLAYKLARDKLTVYGLTDEDIERVPSESGSQKARMTLESPADGVVVSREVVEGNLYDHEDTLLVVAPLDHLWVWANVYEGDLDKVKVGQTWEVRFPYTNEQIDGHVDYVSNRVDPGTHAVRIRATIANPEGKFKADMLVRAILQIPPSPDRTVIPRAAMTTLNGSESVFIEVPDQPGTFERRTVRVAQERRDHVIVSEGLKSGERVVGVGSLLLAQMYDDRATQDPSAMVAASEP